MDHRYGRHGPHAWLHWRAQRYVRPSMLPVPITRQQIAVIYVSTSTERIIIIVLPPIASFDDDAESGNPPIPIERPGPKLIGTSQDEEKDFPAPLIRWAEYEASTRYDSDIQNVLDRGAEWPLEKAIEREAFTKASAALRAYVDSDLDIEKAKLSYVGRYMEVYRKRYQEEIENGTLPNEETRRVQHAAQSDAQIDTEDTMSLSEVELNYQAVLRIQEIFGYRTRAVSGYLTHIMSHIPRYKQAYREEEDRLARSDTFPGRQ
jgi:hypothetical protein